MSTTLDIRTLFHDLEEKLGLRWICGSEFEHKPIHSSADHSAEVSLVGQLNLINPHLIQILGRKELEYFDKLKKNSRKDAIAQLFSGESALVIIAGWLTAPDDLKDAAVASQTPLLSTRLKSQETIENLQYYLTNYFAEKITLHGVFMEVMGTGVLITGESSIGKSELALELLTRGHRLIADDAPEFARRIH